MFGLDAGRHPRPSPAPRCAPDLRRRPVLKEVEEPEDRAQHRRGNRERGELPLAEVSDDRGVDEEIERLGRERAQRRNRESEDLAVVLRAEPHSGGDWCLVCGDVVRDHPLRREAPRHCAASQQDQGRRGALKCAAAVSRQSSTTMPVRPSSITSGTVPQLVAITGVPQAIDSIITSPKGSCHEIGKTVARVLEQLDLLPVRHLADVLAIGAQVRPHVGVEVRPLGGLRTFARDLQRQPRLERDRDGAVRALSGLIRPRKSR